MTPLRMLPAHECERLLRAGVFGRLVLPTPARTEIFPVNYAVMGDAVLVRTAPGSLLDRHADGAPLLLEVDQVDHERWQGWSVVARGNGERIEEDSLTRAERGSPGPPPWVSRDRDVWVRLRWDELSGRKLGDNWDALAAMPVRRVWR
jgi:nitroimidazol reductase NimA-like FMN-containing flavoprotein (pyridoxamine 5'-phosphate oxidase superfamily)